MNPGENHRLVALNVTDPEYKKVENDFKPGNIKSVSLYESFYLKILFVSVCLSVCVSVCVRLCACMHMLFPTHL